MHAVLIHGWKGWPDNAWFPWLRKELEARGWTTDSLALPNPTFPKRREWVKAIVSAHFDADTVVIAHSLGCVAVLGALEEYSGPPLAKVVFVSGFYRPFLPQFIQPIRKEWFPHVVDLSLLKAKARSWVVVHAKLDPLVPFAEGEQLAEQLGVPLVITKRIGHLTQQEHAFEVPEVLDAVLS